MFRVEIGGRKVYRMNVIKGNKCKTQDYYHSTINMMFSDLIAKLEVEDNDDNYD